MAPSIYTPLPSDTPYLNIRLIRLQPSHDSTAPICCKLVCYSLVAERSHLYECLSYVWGSPENPVTVQIDTAEGFVDFDVTQNLYAALLELRDPIFERVIWIDAICINQKDEEEKAQQVVSMTRIYGLASRVVVWLGEEADQSALTFQRLRKLAQQQQPVNRHPQGDHADSNSDGTEELSSKIAYDVSALLSRPYFRRMWVLQEVTAARSILFKCGQAELQGATFLAALDGLPQLDDWKLRNRIRAFMLLIQRSAFRESLKGQDQLHIDSLVDLLDIFHTHETTDNRDKIFALWGLSTESELTSVLRPDYSRSWRSLLTNLGLYVFGEDSNVYPSESRQMLYARSFCRYLGKVFTIHDAGMWDMEQRLEIASMRLSKSLYIGDTLYVTIKMRSSAEKIQNGDIVCFLPRTKNLIFARPESHFLRTISIIGSYSVQITPGKFSKKFQHWSPWQPFLDSMEEEMVEVPFLWSFEQEPVIEGQERWSLMRNHFSSSVRQAYHDAYGIYEAKVLSEMATLHMRLDNYAAACFNLSAIVNGQSLDHDLEADVIANSRELLDVALKRRSVYARAKNLLASQTHNKVDVESSEKVVLCSHIIIHIGMQVILDEGSEEAIQDYIRFRSRMRSAPAHICTELAALIVLEGVRKNMIIEAIEMCGLDWDKLHARPIHYHDASQSVNSLDIQDLELLPRTSDPHNDYLGFLLLMSDQNLGLSTYELSKAYTSNISIQNLNRLLRHCETTVDNLSLMINEVRNRAAYDDFHESTMNYLDSVLEGNADRVSIGPDAILAASAVTRRKWKPRLVIRQKEKTEVAKENWNHSALRTLLDTAKTNRSITSLTLETLVTNYEKLAEEVVRKFAGTIETEWRIGEDTLLTLFGSRYPSERRQRDLIAFFENEKVTIGISEPVLEALLGNCVDAIPFLLYRQDASIIDHWVKPWLLPRLKILLEGTEPLRRQEIPLTGTDSVCKYAQLLNLIRYRRTELKITADLFLRFIAEGKESRAFSKFDAMEKIGCCLIRHAEDKEFEALTMSLDLLSIIALKGCVPLLKDIRCRANNVPSIPEVFSQVAIWGQSTRDEESLRRYHGSEPHHELIESLGTISVPLELQQTLLQLACGSSHCAIRYDVLEDILSRGIINAPLPLRFQETIFRRVIGDKSTTEMLNTLLKHKVIGANATFTDALTTLHIVVDPILANRSWKSSSNMRTQVEILMQHDGAASIDAKDVRGRTPRQTVEEQLENLKRNKRRRGYARLGYKSVLDIFKDYSPPWDKVAPSHRRELRLFGRA